MFISAIIIPGMVPVFLYNRIILMPAQGRPGGMPGSLMTFTRRVFYTNTRCPL